MGTYGLICGMLNIKCRGFERGIGYFVIVNIRLTEIEKQSENYYRTILDKKENGEGIFPLPPCSCKYIFVLAIQCTT